VRPSLNSTTLYSGVSKQSLANELIKESEQVTSSTKTVSKSKQAQTKESHFLPRQEDERDIVQVLESRTSHSDTSWGKLSNHVNNQGVASDEVSSIGLLSVSHAAINPWKFDQEGKAKQEDSVTNSEPSNIAFSHREKKRRGEKRLSDRLAGYGGAAGDLQDLLAIAKETLNMYSPATTRKRHNTDNTGDEEFSSQPTVVEIGRRSNEKAPPSKTPQEVELQMLLTALANDKSHKLDSKLAHALAKVARTVDKSTDTIRPTRDTKDNTFGTYLSEELLEVIISTAGKYLGEEIDDTTLARITETSNSLRDTGGTKNKEGQGLDHYDSPKASKSDDLGEMFRAAYARSPRVDPPEMAQGVLSPPEPPNFTVMAVEHVRRRSNGSIDFAKKSRSSGDGPGVQAKVSDCCVSTLDCEDDLLKFIYENANAEAPRVDNGNNLVAPPIFMETSPHVPKLKLFKSESHASSSEDLESPPLERRTPILSKFLELNRQEQLERTQSGREIPMVSPVTEPTMDMSLTDDEKNRLLVLARPMPDLDEVKTTGKSVSENEPDIEFDQCSSRDADQHSGRFSRIEDASFDTFQELEAILTETRREYGTDLSMDLVDALKKATSSDMGPDSWHDSVSLLMEHIAMESDIASTDESSLHGIAVELGKRLSSRGVCENSSSLSTLIHSLRTKLTEYRRKDQGVEPTARASKHYMSILVDTAQSELGQPLPFDIADKIRRSSVIANAQQNPPVSWEDIELLLQEVCEGQDESIWFEIQEAFFRAWEKSKSPHLERKSSKWGHSSGYISAVSESDASISVLMDDPAEIDHLEDIVEEVRRIHGGEVPQEVVDRLNDRLKRSLSDLDYMKDFGDSSKSSGFFKGSAHSFAFDYSQSTSSVPSTLNSSSLLPPTSTVEDSGELDGLDIIEEVRSQSQTSSSARKEKKMDNAQSSGESHENLTTLIRATSKSNSTVSSLSTSVDTHDSDDEYSMDLKPSTESGTEQNSSDSATSRSTGENSAPISVILPSVRPTVERTHSTNSVQITHSVTVNESLGPDILKEVEKKYAGLIPEELVLVLKNSVTISYSMNSDEDLSVILQEYEGVCHKPLSADLILVLREVSVSLRNSSNSSRSRRSRLIKQSSGSFRSTSRSSGMPSISETGDNCLATRKLSQLEIVCSDTKSDRPTRTSPLQNLAVSRRDSADPEMPHFVTEFKGAGFGVIDRSCNSSDASEESISLESVQPDITRADQCSPVESPGTQFNESEATQLASNVQGQVKAGDLRLDLGTLHSCATSMDSTIEEFAELDASDHTTKSSNRPLDNSDSVSSFGTGVTGHDDPCLGEISGSTTNISTVSRASTLPSRRLPIGVNVSPPLEGIESDDLGVIFAAAAQRMS
jgi:hypothetical protein